MGDHCETCRTLAHLVYLHIILREWRMMYICNASLVSREVLLPSLAHYPLHAQQSPAPCKGREGHNFLNSIPTFICSFIYIQATSNDIYTTDKNIRDSLWKFVNGSKGTRRNMLSLKNCYSERVWSDTVQGLVRNLAMTWCLLFVGTMGQRNFGSDVVNCMLL
jgi:hypothetical protein